MSDNLRAVLQSMPLTTFVLYCTSRFWRPLYILYFPQYPWPALYCSILHASSRLWPQGAHSGPVADICTLEDGSFISGGLADGSIVVFDNKYELIGRLSFSKGNYHKYELIHRLSIFYDICLNKYQLVGRLSSVSSRNMSSLEKLYLRVLLRFTRKYWTLGCSDFKILMISTHPYKHVGLYMIKILFSNFFVMY